MAAKWNVIIVGETGVGKTSMMIRYTKQIFSAHYKATVAVDYLSKDIQVHGSDVKLNIWDSAGQEIYRSIVPQYFRKADGCILVYDATRQLTFNKLSGWLEEFRMYNENAPVIIVGNKCEDSNSKAVTRKSVKSYAEQEGMDFMESSAKIGLNIDLVFETLVEKIWKCQNPPMPPPPEDNSNEDFIPEVNYDEEKNSSSNDRSFSGQQQFEEEKGFVLTEPLPQEKKKGCHC